MSSVNNALNTPYVVGGGSSGYPTQYAVLTGNGTNALNATALTDGQLLIGHSGAAPAAATLTAGTGISIANASGSITITATGATESWSTVTGSTQAAAINSGYINNPSAGCTYTLPSTAAIGSLIQIIGIGGTGWTVNQNASQYIQFGSSVTTTGTGGSLASGNEFDNVSLRCTVANNGWAVVDAVTTQFTIV